ncbi:MAG: helix-turn-helix domain-containing protein [Dehalococcoidia bacterium]|nr:helix-turn-helix domain-containing protein [Dehalococcoidia bacterium]
MVHHFPHFGERLGERRRQQGLSLLDVAERVRARGLVTTIIPQTISGIELMQQKSSSPDMLEEIAQVLGTSLPQLLSESRPGDRGPANLEGEQEHAFVGELLHWMKRTGWTPRRVMGILRALEGGGGVI